MSRVACGRPGGGGPHPSVSAPSGQGLTGKIHENKPGGGGPVTWDQDRLGFSYQRHLGEI